MLILCVSIFIIYGPTSFASIFKPLILMQVKFPDIWIFLDQSWHVRIRKTSVSGQKISGTSGGPLTLGLNSLLWSSISPERAYLDSKLALQNMR